MKKLLSILIGSAIGLGIGLTVSDRVDAIYPRIAGEGQTSRGLYLLMIGSLGGLTGGVIRK